jgi:uncharacterized protein (DUF2147 family)
MMKKTFFLAFLICLTFTAHSQAIVGVWRNVDDATNESKSHIQIYEQNGKVYGKVVKFLRANTDPNRVCSKCTDWRKDQKIMDMMILRDMALNGNTWKGGKILDPENGKEYTCTMWFENGKPNELRLRGWIGPFYRTQTWYRVM